MKKAIALFLCLLMTVMLLPLTLQTVSADDRYLEINETNFHDDNFRQWVIDNLPHEGDAASGYYMTKAQVDNVTEIVLTEDEDGPFYEIESVSGIEFFPALTHLDCSENFLTSLDVSNNTALTSLGCSDNQLTSLDVSRNTALTSLVCEFNELTSLDVSSNTALKQLLCGNNRLSALDVSRNPALEWLDCGGNDDITELDVTKNPALQVLECYGCKVKTLDLSKNTALLELVSSYTELTTLDLSNNTNLQTFIHYGGELTALDLSSNPALDMVWCPENHISYLNAGHLMSLYDLDASAQTIPDQVGGYSDGQYYYDLSSIVPKEILENVTIENATYHLNTTTGIVTFPSRVDSFTYDYDTGYVYYDDEPALMDVTVYLTFEVPSERYLEINETNFPDDNFRQWVIDNLPHEGNAASGYYMTKEQVESVTEINCSGRHMNSLVGIEHFTGLESLDCPWGWDSVTLTSLDVSKNVALTYLSCGSNQLTTLDVSNNTALTYLNCGWNQLTSLDVSNNKALTELDCSGNQLTALDVSKNVALTYLSCGSNQLTTLDVSNNTALTYLNCGWNQLTSLDVSNNTALEGLNCSNNQLTALDVSNNTALTELDCSGNQLTTLDVSKNTALESLDCYSNQLTTLDVGKCIALEWLSCMRNQLTTLDVSNCIALERLTCKSNQLTTLDVSKCIALERLDCDYNALQELDVSNNTALTFLDCGGNQLTTLDVSKNVALETLSCYRNQLAELSISNNAALTELDCSGNQLTTLDLSNNTSLRTLYCSNNHLSILNIGDLTQLTWLQTQEQTVLYQKVDSSNGQYTYNLKSIVPSEYLPNINLEDTAHQLNMTTGVITFSSEVKYFTYLYNTGKRDMDVTVYFGGRTPDRYLEINETNFPDDNFRQWVINSLPHKGDAVSGYYMTQTQVEQLTTISCWGRGILSLVGIEHFEALTSLHCDYNALQELDVSNNTALTFLDCGGNQLTTLDVSKNVALTYLYCSDNQLTTLDASKNAALTYLSCSRNQLTTLNVSNNTALESLSCDHNQLTTLDVRKNVALTYLSCSSNQLTTLDVSNNAALWSLSCIDNHLRTLNVSKNKALLGLSADGQTILDQKGLYIDGTYTYDMKQLMSRNECKFVGFSYSAITMDSDGIVTLPGALESFSYRYNASADPGNGDIELPEISSINRSAKDNGDFMLDVTVYLTYEGLLVFDGTVEWNAEDVRFNGKTPYVIANGQAQTPRFTVKAKDGSVVDASHYTYVYRENVNAGTAYVIITFTDTYSGTAQGWFKIYLPATDYTMVENRDDGIYMEWHAVEGAAGYVIYRRAWSSTTGGKWTDFVRWNNTTDLNWTDKTVYAGTRYQYGIKAYFERRVDPVSGATIGGNVGDNYNLGIVGPLKTTVRITTRKLNSVTGGSKQLTVKWAGSSLFTGYEVQIATDAAFTKNVKTVKITNPKTYQTTIKSLKAKTTYYVRVRSYHVFEGMTYFGGWSNVLSGKTK